MSSRSNTKRRDTSTPELYNTGTFYGLKFFDTINDDVNSNKPVICLPNITLIESNTKAIIDFTGCDTSDYFNQTKIMLDSIQIGDGITLSNAINIDSKTHEENDLSGHYIITNIFSDTIITASVSNVKKTENYDKKYLKENFIDKTEIITSLSGLSGGNRYTVKNYFNNKNKQSFLSLGILAGDKIRFNSGANSGILYDVVSINLDDNKNELLELSGPSFTEENRLESETNFNLYRIDSEIYTNENIVYANSRQSNIFVLEPNFNIDTKKYTFNTNTEISPTIFLAAGVTYVINLLNSRLGFSISDTPDGIWNGGNEYKNITRYNANVMLVNFPSSDTLYYYDTFQRNAGGKIIVTSDEIDNTTRLVLELNSQYTTQAVPLVDRYRQLIAGLNFVSTDIQNSNLFY